jgi:hypothetical protein
MRRLALAAAAALALALPGCMGPRAPGGGSFDALDPGSAAWWTMPVVPGEEEAEKPDAKEEGKSAVGIGWAILMYLPNRVLDAFDMVRFGVNLGPGVGGQLKATEAAQLEFMSRMSAGVGLQGLRHLPVYASVENYAGVSVAEADSDIGLGWYQSPTDIRFEAHPLLAGAHVAIDPLEILDFVVGIFTFDTSEDDY